MNGYELLRSYIHQNCVTGVLHGIFMPISIYGVGLMIKSITNYSAHILGVILVLQTLGYLLIDPLMSLVNCYFYICVLIIINERPGNFRLGLILLLVGWVMMEPIGHWIIERNASDLRYVVNSIYWTPLYGMRSLFNREICT